MEMFAPVLIPLAVIGFLVLVVFGMMAAAAAERRRRESFAALAAEHGWRYVEGKDKGFRHQFPEFECFGQGHSRYAERVLEGSRAGRRLVAFDYHYAVTSSTGKTTTTTHYRFSGVIVEPGLRLEPLSLRTEHFGDRITAFLGMGDIDFELAEFNRAFHVRSPNRRFATDLLQPSTLEFLLAAPRFRVEVESRRILAWRNDRFEPTEFLAALGVIEGILERLPPSFVLERRQPAV